VIEVAMVEASMAALGIDARGLGDADQRLLRSLSDKFLGGPVGLETLAASISEDEGTVTDVIEPFLMSLGLIERTGRGRQLTMDGREYLGC
jgi:Holliday junction DNA helicase RuvB